MEYTLTLLKRVGTTSKGVEVNIDHLARHPEIGRTGYSWHVLHRCLSSPNRPTPYTRFRTSKLGGSSRCSWMYIASSRIIASLKICI